MSEKRVTTKQLAEVVYELAKKIVAVEKRLTHTQLAFLGATIDMKEGEQNEEAALGLELIKYSLSRGHSGKINPL